MFRNQAISCGYARESITYERAKYIDSMMTLGWLLDCLSWYARHRTTPMRLSYYESSLRDYIRRSNNVELCPRLDKTTYMREMWLTPEELEYCVNNNLARRRYEE